MFDPNKQPYTKLEAETREGGQLEKTTEDKALRAWADSCAGWTAGFVCIGEGAVAGVAIWMLVAATWAVPVLPIVLGVLVGIAGALTNFYLFRGDTYDMLLRIFEKKPANGNPERMLPGIYLDDAGKEIPLWAKIVNWSALTLALGAGFVYGALSAFSLFSSLLVPLLSSIGFTHIAAMVLGGILAACPVLFTMVAMAAIFFMVITDFVNNQRWLGIMDYVRDTYFPAYFSELTTQEKWAHCLVHVPFHLLKLLLGLSICLIVTAASFGVFHKSSVHLLKLIACPAGAAIIIAYIPTVMTMVLNFIFGEQKICDLAGPITVRHAVYGLLCLPLVILQVLVSIVGLIPISALQNWHQEFQDTMDQYYKALWEKAGTWVRGETFADIKHPATQSRQSRSQAAWFMLLTLSVQLNAVGQGALFAETGGLFLHHVTQLGMLASNIISGLSAAVFSAVPNDAAFRKAEASREPHPIPEIVVQPGVV